MIFTSGDGLTYKMGLRGSAKSEGEIQNLVLMRLEILRSSLGSLPLSEPASLMISGALGWMGWGSWFLARSYQSFGPASSGPGGTQDPHP